MFLKALPPKGFLKYSFKTLFYLKTLVEKMNQTKHNNLITLFFEFDRVIRFGGL